ncbi:iron ABC transporter ATP-binding protein [Candidatus Fermentibacteria bacterium]|nr:MAG: iron ABC transporter ATP-binding protein [Candidatus Fermentibacteria bacterium]
MILKVENLCFSYGNRKVLKNISFSLENHRLTVVLGPNGSGKTTLLRCLNGILKPDSGSVCLSGKKLADYSRREIARKVAYVAQRNEPGRITAFDAVLLGRKPHIGLKVSSEDIRLTCAALHRMGLDEMFLRHTDSMSGGEHQRVCIARALVGEPEVMLMDEPAASLDMNHQLATLRLLRTIVKGHETSVLATMHDLNTAFRYADRFLFMKNGRITASVDSSEITEEIIEEVYSVPVSVKWHQDHPYVLPLDDRNAQSNSGIH